MEGETREGEIEIEEGAKDLNFGGISRSSRDAADDLIPDQLAEPFMFCLILLLSIVRREEAAIQKGEVFLFYEDRFKIFIESWRPWRRGQRRKKKRRDVMVLEMFLCFVSYVCIYKTYCTI